MRGSPFLCSLRFFSTRYWKYPHPNWLGRPRRSTASPFLFGRLLGHDLTKAGDVRPASGARATKFLRIFDPTRGVATPQALVTVLRLSPTCTLPAIANCKPGRQRSRQPASTQAERLVGRHRQHAARLRRRSAPVEKGMSWLATTGAVSPFIVCLEPFGASLTHFPASAALAPPAFAPSLRIAERS